MQTVVVKIIPFIKSWESSAKLSLNNKILSPLETSAVGKFSLYLGTYSCDPIRTEALWEHQRVATMEEEIVLPAANEPKLDDEAQAHVPTPIWVRLKR